MHDNQQNDSAEQERLRRLEQFQISRTPPETAFDDIVRLAADQFGAPIAFLCLTEAECNWFKARRGIDLEEVPRSISFCDHTLKGEGVMVVPDATLDERFAESPMVTGPHHIRFYAGITLKDSEGFALGTLAVADIVARQATEQQKDSLKRLASIALNTMELKKIQNALRKSVADMEVARQQAVSDRGVLRQTIDCLPQAIALVDTDNKFVLWNKNYEKMFPELSEIFKPGVSIESVYRYLLKNSSYSPPMDAVTADKWLKDRLDLLNRGDSVVEQIYGDQRWIRYDQHLAPDGKKIYVRTDVTDDRNAAISFRLLFENNPVPMWVVEKSSLRYIDVNTAALAHYGYTRDQFLKMTLLDIRPPREHERILEDARTNFGADSSDEDWIHLKADGTEIIVTTYSKPIKYQGRDAAIVAIIDITERRKHEARVQYLVEHDALTGLPNRSFFLELLEGSLSKRAQNHYYTSIILIDIDDFKGVNDTLGHQVGDNLIVAVANRLEECIGDRGVVARLGGDEFVILLPMLADPEEAHAAAIELINAFETPLAIPHHDLLVRISAGVSSGLDNSIDPSTLLMNADLALYKAKSDGGGVCRIYEPQMSLQMIVHREMERDLRQALANNQLVIHYQPLLELAGCTEVGFEALLRWNHPEKGMIPPSAFIPIAESSGMIVAIGTWVLEQSCQLATTWKKNLSIAVNVSPAQFKSGKLVAIIAAALEKSGLAAHRLELEITESVLLEKSSETLEILKSLKNLGVSIALDDFGIGYSGLGYLNSFPIDKIKIDQSFIRDIGIKSKAVELIRAAINIGQSLGIETLAEGIETKEQLEILQTLGCQLGQGFLFSRAIPAGDIADALKLKGNLHSTRLTA
ncbi:MAG: EAL domain-containing protein [Hyphomicrobiales bacterium]|nr:EAL domain-containing protein [Hyphomicrobiales bacterium]